VATYTEFYCDPVNGSNLNGGSDSGSPSMSDTAGTGSWNSSTNVYTSVATTGSVAVGQFMSIYAGSATDAVYTARITAVSGGSGSVWTITLSSTAFSGAKPGTASSYKAQVGGAWKGPNGADSFPFGYMTSALTDSSGDSPRCNMKNNGTYSVTSGVSDGAIGGPRTFQGYSSAVGDGGKANIDGGTNAIVVLTTATGTNSYNTYADLTISNNGTSGSNAGISVGGTVQFFLRCVVHDVRGNAFISSQANISYIECEAYNCNGSNSSSIFSNSGTGAYYNRCIAHNNSGSNSNGFQSSAGGCYTNCIADTNGGNGFYSSSTSNMFLVQYCSAYNNTGDGLRLGNTSAVVRVENSDFVLNGGYGINSSSGAVLVPSIYCNNAFGAGTKANTSGQTHNLTLVVQIGTVTYPNDVTPWVSPSTGNFSINAPFAERQGRGNFTQTQANYSGAQGYPDVGACPANEAIYGGSIHTNIGTY